MCIAKNQQFRVILILANCAIFYDFLKISKIYPSVSLFSASAQLLINLLVYKKFVFNVQFLPGLSYDNLYAVKNSYDNLDNYLKLCSILSWCKCLLTNVPIILREIGLFVKNM